MGTTVARSSRTWRRNALKSFRVAAEVAVCLRGPFDWGVGELRFKTGPYFPVGVAVVRSGELSLRDDPTLGMKRAGILTPALRDYI